MFVPTPNRGSAAPGRQPFHTWNMLKHAETACEIVAWIPAVAQSGCKMSHANPNRNLARQDPRQPWLSSLAPGHRKPLSPGVVQRETLRLLNQNCAGPRPFHFFFCRIIVQKICNATVHGHPVASCRRRLPVAGAGCQLQPFAVCRCRLPMFRGRIFYIFLKGAEGVTDQMWLLFSQVTWHK